MSTLLHFMNGRNKHGLSFFIIFISLISSVNAINPSYLRCEYRSNPIGIDAVKPRLGWIVNSDKRGDRQTAYELLIATSARNLAENKGDLWATGKVSSDQSIQIVYSGKPISSLQFCFWKVRVWDKDGIPSKWSETAFWSMGMLQATNWKAKWIGVEETLAPKPPRSEHLAFKPGDSLKLLATPRYLRKDFLVEKHIKRAIVYATSLGVYELRMNGQRVGDQLLSPEWTNYAKRIQYQPYDVTSMLKSKRNTLAATLGNGWYCGLWQHWPLEVRMYGDEPLLLAQLEIEFADGSKQIVVTDNSWLGTVDGPIRFSGIYEGEYYDSRKEMPGWDTPGFNASEWKSVKIVEKPASGKLVWQRSDPIRKKLELKPVKITEPKPGVYVYAFNQNLAGWSRFRFKGTARAIISLQHAEMLNTNGTVFIDNLHLFDKADRQLDFITCKDTSEITFEPHFTYHGFQYVEVRGLTYKPDINDLTGVVFGNDCPETGKFTCSNTLINKLVENCMWSQRANFMGVPTDCPQRDERCGYPGDAQFFMPTALYNMDVASFFNKCLVDLCQDSYSPENGAFGDHMPSFDAGGWGNVGWGDAGIILPYFYYRTYADTTLLREHYTPMRNHMQFWIDRNNGSSIKNSGGPLDWLNLNCPTKSEVIATAYYAYMAMLMSEMANVLGKQDDAVRFNQIAKQARDAFVRTFVKPDGSILESSQTGFALAFTMGLVPDTLKKRMANQYVAEIAKFDDHLATGFIGTPRLLPGLHAAERDDIAYKLLLTNTYPSWLYPVTLGATTIWERWDGYDGKTPAGGMNSLNHYAFGSVVEYLYRTVAGISEEAPGYKRIRIAPALNEGLSWVNASYKSIYGTIESDWKILGNQLAMDVIIPANTTATIVIPTTDLQSIREGDTTAFKAEGVKFINFENGNAIFEVASGKYLFKSAYK